MILEVTIRDKHKAELGHVRLKLDYAAKQWSVEQDQSRVWARVGYSSKGSLEVRDNAVTWLWDQQPGKERHNIIIVQLDGESDIRQSWLGFIRLFDWQDRTLDDLPLVAVLNARQLEALRLVDQFLTRTDRGEFPQIDRRKVGQDLMEKIKRPQRVNQGSSNTCGPAAFLYAIVRNDPVTYAKYVTSLYDRGYATLGTMDVRPSDSFRFDSMPSGQGASDWIALGSLRDSQNWFFEYHHNELPFLNARTDSDALNMEGIRGGTSDGEVEDWFYKAGYTRILNRTKLFHSDSDNLALANSCYKDGYIVVLKICANMIAANAHKPDEVKLAKREGLLTGLTARADHFIVLASPIEIGETVKCSFFTWGRLQNVPTFLTRDEFLNNYYGFIAAAR